MQTIAVLDCASASVAGTFLATPFDVDRIAVQLCGHLHIESRF